VQKLQEDVVVYVEEVLEEEAKGEVVVDVVPESVSVVVEDEAEEAIVAREEEVLEAKAREEEDL
jgi:hypothetical protein